MDFQGWEESGTAVHGPALPLPGSRPGESLPLWAASLPGPNLLLWTFRQGEERVEALNGVGIVTIVIVVNKDAANPGVGKGHSTDSTKNQSPLSSP